MEVPKRIGIIAGSGVYPLDMAHAARKAGVQEIVAVAFPGETSEQIERVADTVEWIRVGKLGAMLRAFRQNKVRKAVMAGQIAPSNLFDLQPDIKALLLLAKLKKRNAESIFGAVANELEAAGVEVLPASAFMEDQLVPVGHFAGPRPGKQIMTDIAYGREIAKETSGMDIGQTVVVRSGTVLAVEAFEGTNESIRRGGALGKGRGVVVKVSKPEQDFRFDIPVIGSATLEAAAASGIAAMGLEAGRTLLLERERVVEIAMQSDISLVGFEE